MDVKKLMRRTNEELAAKLGSWSWKKRTISPIRMFDDPNLQAIYWAAREREREGQVVAVVIREAA